MSKLYENLLKATNNIDDITTEKYGVITKLDGIYCSVKETDNDLEHNNVPILNGANLSVGDKVILGFLNNSIYDVVCYGALDKTVHDDSKQDTLVSGTSIKTINNTSLLGSGNISIGGGGSSVDIATTWGNPTSDSKVPSEKLAKDSLDTKANSNHTHTKSEITDFPTKMPASDVHDWAKAENKPSYSWSEITNKPTEFKPAVHNHDEYYYRKEKVTEMIQDPTANTPGVCVGYGLDILGGY